MLYEALKVVAGLFLKFAYVMLKGPNKSFKHEKSSKAFVSINGLNFINLKQNKTIMCLSSKFVHS